MLFQRLGWCVQDELQGKNVPDKPGQAENKDDLRGVEFQHNPAQAPRVPASVGADCTRLSQGFMKRCTWTLVSFLCLPLDDIRRIFKNKLFRSKWIFSKNQMIGIKKKKKNQKALTQQNCTVYTFGGKAPFALTSLCQLGARGSPGHSACWKQGAGWSGRQALGAVQPRLPSQSAHRPDGAVVWS